MVEPEVAVRHSKPGSAHPTLEFYSRPKGSVSVTTPALTAVLDPTSQFASAVYPTGSDPSTFQFFARATTPVSRSGPFFHFLGDFSLAVRWNGSTSAQWERLSSASHLPASSSTPPPFAAAAADVPLTPPLSKQPPPPSSASAAVAATRWWAADGADLLLGVVLAVADPQKAVEVGDFEFSFPVDNVFSNRDLPSVGVAGSFPDVVACGRGGYATGTRVSGAGPAVVGMPTTQLLAAGAAAVPGAVPWGVEAGRPIEEEPTGRGVTFEGFYAVMAHSKASAQGWVQHEYSSGGTWMPPTSRAIAGSSSVTFVLRIAAVAGGPAAIPDAVVERGGVAAVAVPGYVVPADTVAPLVALRRLPTAAPIVSVTSPAGSLVSGAVGRGGGAPAGTQIVELAVSAPPAAASYAMLQANQSAIDVVWGDGMALRVHFYVTPPAAAHVDKYAASQVRNAYYTDSSDPFNRTPAFYSRDQRGGGLVLQDDLAWIPGLSDECGAGPGLGLAWLSRWRPTMAAIDRLDAYVHTVLWGRLQHASGSAAYGVRASMFFSGMPGYPYTVTPCWDEPRSETLWRAYNYPHPAAVYFAMYGLARYYPDTIAPKLRSPWRSYLTQAANTLVLGMRVQAGYYLQFGLMVGSVFTDVLAALEAEGMHDAAMEVGAVQALRAQLWSTQPFPFGSEMPWDSTGQEEVWTGAARWGYPEMAAKTLAAVVAYAPVAPGWAWQGNSRRYFDALVYGGLVNQRIIEREFFHYGAPLNAIVLLGAYRRNATAANLHLLLAGLSGIAGTLSVIDPGGGDGMCWLGAPYHMVRDPVSCDFGVGFYGHAREASAVWVAALGPLGGAGACFHCSAAPVAGGWEILPGDSMRRRVFLQSYAVDVLALSGQIAGVAVVSGLLTVTLSPPADPTAAAAATLHVAVMHYPVGATPVPLAPQGGGQAFGEGWAVQCVGGVAKVSFALPAAAEGV